MFGATVESLSKASSTLMLRIGTDAHLYDDPDDAPIAPLLDSRFDSDKAEALKRLLALIAQGADVSNFFPQVVKNVASQSVEVKKLVYLYLLHYAEKRPDEALLSINYFQKDLSDTNPLVRAWALRAMAGIRLHVVAPLVLVAVGKCARDPSAYVRKCAAHALPKLYDLHQEENVTPLEELVSILLSDQSPGVVGAAASAFNRICPNNLALIGKNFRRLCETLPDVEEWGQIVLIEILLRYVVTRHGLVKESIMFSSSSTKNSQSDQDLTGVPHISDSRCGIKEDEESDNNLNMLMFKYYIQGQEELLSHTRCTSGDFDMLDNVILTSRQNDDVNILLRCTSPLLWSQNSAVVLAAAGLHWIMAPKEEVKRIVKPLLFLLRSSTDSKYVILCNVQVFAKAVPSLFAPYCEDFFVCTLDSYQIKALKLEILSTIATNSSIPIIFEEFQDYIKDPDRRFVADTIAAIGLCAKKLPSVAGTCLEGLLSLIAQESSTSNWSQMNGEAGVLVQAIMSIKTILKQKPSDHEKVIVRLARSLDFIKEASARALIVWIVGEYNSSGHIISGILPTLLKYLAWCFSSEEVEAKHQILNTVAKVVLCAQGEELLTFRMILSYILELAKHDLDYDVRDRARTIEKLIPCHITSLFQEEGSSYSLENGDFSREFADNILNGKIPCKNEAITSFRFYLPGSLSQIVLHAAPGPLSTNNLPTILPMEEIASLDPGQTIKRTLQARFHHHLLPLKLVVSCNGQNHFIKLRPDIGYFVRPHSMNTESFIDLVSKLSGMFEYVKRCTYTDHIKEPEHEDDSLFQADKILVVSRSLASKVLSNASVYLVSVDMPVSFGVDDASGLCLRFSSEILSSSKPCLITLVAEGKCAEALNITVKVNCEDTIFGANLLNRVVEFLG